LPSSTQRSIELNYGQKRVSPKYRFGELALKKIPFSIENLKVTVQAPLISNEREPVGFRQRANQKLLLRELFGRPVVCDQ
jgi:hypothetical protein